jgi:hypothetical protein
MLGVRKFHHVAQANRGNLKSPVLQNIQAKAKEQDKRTATLEGQMQMVSSFFSLLRRTPVPVADTFNVGFHL